MSNDTADGVRNRSRAEPRKPPVRLGIVGMGGRGRGLIGTCELVRECRVTALCDRYAHLLARGLESAKAKGFDGVEGYQDFEQMLKADIDAVAVIVEPQNQPDLICRALAAGKHVYAEVPLAYTIADCWRIVLAVERSGLKFQMAEQLRYAAWAKAWKQMVADGKLGKILYGEGQYLHGLPLSWYWHDAETGEQVSLDRAGERPVVKSRLWQMSHPILYLPHELSPLLHILEDRVKSVTCMATRRPSYRHEWFPVPDIEVALMCTEKDTVLRLMTGFVVEFAPGTEHCNRLIGTKGWVEQDRASLERGAMWLADQPSQALPWEARPRGEESQRSDLRAPYAPATWNYDADEMPPEMTQVAISAEDVLTVRRSGHGGLDYYPLATFVDSILRDTQPPMDVYMAADTAAPAILAAESVEQGCVCLEVPDFRPGANRRPGQPPSDSAS